MAHLCRQYERRHLLHPGCKLSALDCILCCQLAISVHHNFSTIACGCVHALDSTRECQVNGNTKYIGSLRCSQVLAYIRSQDRGVTLIPSICWAYNHLTTLPVAWCSLKEAYALHSLQWVDRGSSW